MATTKKAAAPAATDPIHIDFGFGDGPKRRMQINIPSPEQLAVWHSVGERFTQLGQEWAATAAALEGVPDDDERKVAFRTRQGEQATRGIGRGLKIIKSVLASEDDYLWIEDAIMDGATLGEALGVVTAAAAALRERAAATPSAPAKPGKAKLVS